MRAARRGCRHGKGERASTCTAATAISRHLQSAAATHSTHDLLLRTNSHPKLPHARPRTRRAFQNHDALSSIPDIKCAVTFGDQSSDSWLAQEYSQKHEHPAIVATGDGEFTAFSDVDTHCRAFNDATSTGATPSTDDAMNTEYDDLLDSDTTDGECVGVLMHHAPVVCCCRVEPVYYKYSHERKSWPGSCVALHAVRCHPLTLLRSSTPLGLSLSTPPTLPRLLRASPASFSRRRARVRLLQQR